MQKLIIEQITQTLPRNCVSATLAMVLDKPIDTVTEEFHEDYINQKTNPWDYLNAAGIKYRHCLASERKLKANHVYIMSVPSLNIPLNNHSIIIQMTENGESWFIIDPAKGREGRESYGNDRNLVGWSPDFEFAVEDILAYRAGRNE